jgi:hypothetical protein
VTLERKGVTGMRRIIAAVVIIVMNIGVVAHADAATIPWFDRAVSGPFHGTSDFERVARCSFFHQDFDATYVPGHRTGSFDIKGCVKFNPMLQNPFRGSFVLTTPDGATLNGNVSGVIGNGGGSCRPGLFPGLVDFTLVVTAATKEFQHHLGSIHLDGTWCSPGIPGKPGPIRGALHGHLS